MKCGQTPSRQQMPWLNAKEDMVPGEFQLGLCKLVNSYKKKWFFLNSPCSQRFGGQMYLPFLWPLSIEREKCPEKVSVASICDQLS